VKDAQARDGKHMQYGKYLAGFAALGGLIVACAPKVTVSKDDTGEIGGAAGAQDEVGGTGGGDVTGGVGGSAGLQNEVGGTGGGDVTGGVGGSAGLQNEVGGSAGWQNEVGGSAGQPMGGHSGFESGGSSGSGWAGDMSGIAGSPSFEPCTCSRRPDAPPSMSCPRGEDASITESLGPDGGVLALDGTRSTRGAPFEIDVFPGSLADSTEITLHETTATPPEEFIDWSPIFAVNPVELEFVNGGAISIPWSNTPNQVGGLVIYYSESPDGPFELLEDSYQNAGFSQATLLRGGFFFVASERESGNPCP
jgi:hypothetical protein